MMKLIKLPTALVAAATAMGFLAFGSMTAYAEPETPTPAPSSAPATPEPTASNDETAEPDPAAPTNSEPAQRKTNEKNPTADELRAAYIPATEPPVWEIEYKRGYRFDYFPMWTDGEDPLPGDLTLETRNGKNVTCEPSATVPEGSPGDSYPKVQCEATGGDGAASVEQRLFFTMPDGEQLIMFDWTRASLLEKWGVDGPLVDELRSHYWPGGPIDPWTIEIRKGYKFDLSMDVEGDRPLPYELTVETRDGDNLACQERDSIPQWADPTESSRLAIPCEVIADGTRASIEARVFFTTPDGEQLVMMDWKRVGWDDSEKEPSEGPKAGQPQKPEQPGGGRLAETGGPALLGLLGTGLAAAAAGVGLIRRRIG